jgi:outer membrane protein OmpA-like peptidoglycan-associated protein
MVWRRRKLDVTLKAVKPLGLILLLNVLPVCAQAQVTVNPAALGQLAGAPPPPAAAPAAPMPAVHTLDRRPAVSRHVAPRPVIAAPLAAAQRPSKQQPAVVPPTLAMAAPVVLNFAPESADLPANANLLLAPDCVHARAGGRLGINAYAPAAGTDISAPMRLSMRRAFAVRDALAACGVPAANIIARADGAAPGQNTATATITLSGP